MRPSRNYPEVESLASKLGGVKSLPPLKDIASQMNITRQTLYTFMKGGCPPTSGVYYSILFKSITGIDLSHLYPVQTFKEEQPK